ncbi:MAG: phosphoesterase, partial [Nitrospirae bacterium]|nr:phosphoesterase [Fimbriimonadaceae bacterium]
MHLALLGCLLLSPQPQWVGDGFTPTGMLLRPAGRTIPFGGRPVDVVIPKGGAQALVKDMGGLRVVDLAAGTESLVAAAGGASTFGLTETSQGTILFTNAASGMHEFATSNGKWTHKRTINLPGLEGKGASYPVGVATQGDRAYVCLSRNNQLAEVDLESGKVLRTFEVGVAPYGVALVPGAGLALVSNQGGRRPAPGDTTAPSAGTETVVDERGIASTGMVTVVNLRSGQTFGSIRVGLQPNAVTLLEAPYAAVANANSDSVSIVDYLERREVVRHQVKPNEGVPFGSMPNALAYDAGAKRLYVANAGNNALVVLDVANPRTPRTLGFLPTGWYPAAVALTPSSVVVVNNKGMG